MDDIETEDPKLQDPDVLRAVIDRICALQQNQRAAAATLLELKRAFVWRLAKAAHPDGPSAFAMDEMLARYECSDHHLRAARDLADPTRVKPHVRRGRPL
jgi:hypothetical protein